VATALLVAGSTVTF